MGKKEKMVKMECPACSGQRSKWLGDILFECTRCGCVHGKVSYGEFRDILAKLAEGRRRSFDLKVLGSEGIRRYHGWVGGGEDIQWG